MRKFLPAFLIIIPFAAMAIFNLLAWPHLPDRIVIHWDFQGQPNGWTSKAGVWFLPFFFLWPALLIRGITWRLPGSEPDPNGAAVNYMTAAIGAFFVLLHAEMMLWALYSPTRPQNFKLALNGLSLLMLLLGRGLQLSKKNHFLGIRTRWTLASDENWNKTHEFAGRNLAASGLLLMPLTAFLQPHPLLVIGVLIGNMVAAVIYSYRLQKAH